MNAMHFLMSFQRFSQDETIWNIPLPKQTWPQTHSEPVELHVRSLRSAHWDGVSGRGPQSALDIHLLSDHLSVTFPQRSPAWGPQVLHDDADMHCWRVTGFWRGPRAPSQLRQVFPYMMSDMSMGQERSPIRKAPMGTKSLRIVSGVDEADCLTSFVQKMTTLCCP